MFEFLYYEYITPFSTNVLQCLNGSARPSSKRTAVDHDESIMDEDDENKEHSHN